MRTRAKRGDRLGPVWELRSFPPSGRQTPLSSCGGRVGSQGRGGREPGRLQARPGRSPSPSFSTSPPPPPRSDPKASGDCPAGKGCLLGSRMQLPYFELGCVSPFLERTPSPHASFLGLQPEALGRPSSVPFCDSV